MRKKRYFGGIERIRELCRQYVYDLEQLKKISPQLRELQRNNPRVPPETLIDAWEAFDNADWTAVMSFEKDEGIDYGFEEPLFV